MYIIIYIILYIYYILYIIYIILYIYYIIYILYGLIIRLYLTHSCWAEKLKIWNSQLPSPSSLDTLWHARATWNQTGHSPPGKSDQMVT